MQTLLNLLAAIALLVWGTHIVRSGVLRVYGASLRQVLRLSVGNRATSFAAGVGVTGVLQSLTATALLASSFVSQGMITTSAALAVMLGADVGTALMVQFFSLNLAWLAPLLIVAGVVVYLSRKNERAGQIGFVGRRQHGERPAAELQGDRRVGFDDRLDQGRVVELLEQRHVFVRGVGRPAPERVHGCRHHGTVGDHQLVEVLDGVRPGVVIGRVPGGEIAIADRLVDRLHRVAHERVGLEDLGLARLDAHDRPVFRVRQHLDPHVVRVAQHVGGFATPVLGRGAFDPVPKHGARNELARQLGLREIDRLGRRGCRAFRRAETGEARLPLETIGQLVRRVDRLEGILEAYREGSPPDRRDFDALQRRLADVGIESDEALDDPERPRAEDKDGADDEDEE